MNKKRFESQPTEQNPPTVVGTLGPLPSKPKRASTRFLSRHVLPSDQHGFIGRIWGLGIVAYHFDSYEDLCRHSDCKYVFHVNHVLTALTTRVESLNLAGSMLWPDPLPEDFREFPLSRHEWLTASADVFLTRYISVVDCATLLVNEIYELGLAKHLCDLKRVRKAGVPAAVISALEAMIRDQGHLRSERNARVHHGNERSFTQDNQTFKIAAIFEHRANGMTGTDRFGRRINLDRMFREGLVELQREFNRSTRTLVRLLDCLYNALWDEFEDRFVPRFRAAIHGLNGSSTDSLSASATQGNAID